MTIGGAANMTIFQTQGLNNSPTPLQRSQREALIDTARDKLINHIFYRPVEVSAPSMLNNMTRTVTPTGISLWQTKYY